MEKLFDLSDAAKENGIMSHGILKINDTVSINLAYIDKNSDGDVDMIEQAQEKYDFWVCYGGYKIANSSVAEDTEMLEWLHQYGAD